MRNIKICENNLLLKICIVSILHLKTLYIYIYSKFCYSLSFFLIQKHNFFFVGSIFIWKQPGKMKNQNHQKQKGKNPVSFSRGHKILLFQSLLFFQWKEKRNKWLHFQVFNWTDVSEFPLLFFPLNTNGINT